MLEGIEHDAIRMDLIVMQLVDASRMAAGRLRLAQEPVDLRETVEAVAAEARRGGTAEVEAEPGPDPAQVVADRPRLRSILLAMIEGANWWGETGPVQVRVRPGPPREVVVSKEGSMLDPAEADAVFRPRPPGTGGGTKVGLYVAKGLAEAHGGAVEIDARGSVRFTLTLPATTPDPPRAERRRG
jgi:signal transduction histidine kinase